MEYLVQNRWDIYLNWGAQDMVTFAERLTAIVTSINTSELMI